MYISKSVSKDLTEHTIASRLAIWHTAGIGPSKFFSISNYFNDIKEVFSAPLDLLRSIGISEKIAIQLKKPNWQLVEEDLNWAQHANQHIVCWDDDPAYPELLKEISGAPPILFARGDITLLKSAQIGIVGSRNPSHTGNENAYKFAKYLASCGYTITSGLAAGIDTASHKGALAAKGKTIAVLGTGIEHIYPRCNYKLAEIISNDGLIISEFARLTGPAPHNFPRRNRIISGLSTGILVVEAALKSGSLITANYANEQNRDVFAIPGSIHNPLSRGCHSLIRNGAKLAESADDIIEELGSLTNFVQNQQFDKNTNESLDKEYQKLVKCIGYEATPMDVLINRSGLSPQVITPLLLELELKNLVISDAGGYLRK